ncbi:oxalate decarboxylase [Anaerocolumna jejuensis DSM 15929]|uniref:Oxalate decarboxylase n=1 Tax=Anaerocolumna jejuensis DSM 15929 TaxID=1121322 RepID=A0A1M7BDS5_9FIRM|nr:cupin domain-containing protein [Anaerocolumna jejuensis]SHL53006.1 oxalate decarboxylase [Anaerocolumna jejuensis DSM 15929]
MQRNTQEELNKKIEALNASNIPEPIRSDGFGALDKGPRNIGRDKQNPDMLVPPATDFGLLPNLKFSFADAHMTLKPGGWSREITKREFPVSDTFALINMCLDPGIREMHSHQQSEWGYVLVGSIRVTSVDEMGRNFIDDVSAGEGWLFPANIPHSLQALEEGTEFILLFDKGYYSESSTFSVSDLFAHMPLDILSANFGTPESTFSNIPKNEVYIVEGGDPGTINQQKIQSPYEEVPFSYKHQLNSVPPIESAGGTIRILDSKNFPACKTVAAVLVEVEPGGMREIHWHTNKDEFQYYISGEARMTVFMPGPKARTFNYRAGDVGYVPMGGFHYIQNVGTETLRFLEFFNSDFYSDVSLAQWLALTPKEMVKSCLNLPDDFIDQLNKKSTPVVKYSGFEFPPAQGTPQNKIRFTHP